MAWTGNTVRHLQAANVIHEKKNIQSIVSKNQCGNCKSLILPPPRSSNLFFWRCFTCDHWLQSVQGSDIEYVSELKVSQKEKTYIIDINDNENIIDALLNLDLTLVRNRNHADELLSNEIEQKFLRSFLLQNIKLSDGKYKWSINLTSIKNAMNNLRSFPKIDKNNKVDTKSLCIYGQKSDYVNQDHFQIFKNYFSNILFHKIKNAGHFLHIENPDEFYEVSKNFFKD